MVEIKLRYTPQGSSSRRSKSRVYYVQQDSEVATRVCRTAFLHIHDVSSGRVDRALNAAAKAGGSPHMDRRGHHEPGNKSSEHTLSLIKEHIDSFPQYESYYSRIDNPNRKYLCPDLTIAKMYSMYKDTCCDRGEEPASEWLYRKTFNESFNLGFGR